MNPDGFALRRRGNANNVDLNRDFPDQVSSCIRIGIIMMNTVLYFLRVDKMALKGYISFICSLKLFSTKIIADDIS